MAITHLPPRNEGQGTSTDEVVFIQSHLDWKAHEGKAEEGWGQAGRERLLFLKVTLAGDRQPVLKINYLLCVAVWL